MCQVHYIIDLTTAFRIASYSLRGGNGRANPAQTVTGRGREVKPDHRFGGDM